MRPVTKREGGSGKLVQRKKMVKPLLSNAQCRLENPYLLPGLFLLAQLKPPEEAQLNPYVQWST